MAGIACLSLRDTATIPALLAPVQLSVGVRGGVEVAVHRLQTHVKQRERTPTLSSSCSISLIAFMKADRSLMLQALFFKFPDLSPIWRLAHLHVGSVWMKVELSRFNSLREGHRLASCS